MKHTKLAGFVIGLVFLFVISVKGSVAVVSRDINNLILKPTATPTKTETASPTPEPTVIPTNLLTTTETIAPTNTPTDTPVPEITVAVSNDATDTSKTQDNLTFWFLVVTVGLLAVIIVIQAWPKKNEGEEKEE